MRALGDLYQLTKADITPAARILALTFQDYPFCVAIEPDGEIRRNKGHLMYEFLVKLGLRYGTVYAPSNNLEGIAVWFPSEKANFTTWQMIVSGVLTLYIKFSRATMDRWAKIVAFYLEMHEELVPFPHMYLYWMGVDVTKQKQGFGGILMQAMLDHIDKQGIPCFLETHKQNNIVYFKRFGFEVVNEHKVPGTNVPGWSLLRKV